MLCNCSVISGADDEFSILWRNTKIVLAWKPVWFLVPTYFFQSTDEKILHYCVATGEHEPGLVNKRLLLCLPKCPTQ